LRVLPLNSRSRAASAIRIRFHYQYQIDGEHDHRPRVRARGAPSVTIPKPVSATLMLDAVENGELAFLRRFHRLHGIAQQAGTGPARINRYANPR